MKEEARRLRREGMSYAEIAEKTGVNKRTVRSWVCDIKLSEEEISKKISERKKLKESKRYEDNRIDEEELRRLVEEFGVFGARERLSTTEGVVRYWAKQYGIKVAEPGRRKKHDSCGLCKKQYEENRKKKPEFCCTCTSKIRRLTAKIRAINKKGGSCSHCGLEANDKNYAGFEFHHPDGNKDFGVGNILNAAWNKIEEEIDKCVLLCSVCHRVQHSDYNNPELIAIVKDKHGWSERSKA